MQTSAHTWGAYLWKCTFAAKRSSAQLFKFAGKFAPEGASLRARVVRIRESLSGSGQRPGKGWAKKSPSWRQALGQDGGSTARRQRGRLELGRLQKTGSGLLLHDDGQGQVGGNGLVIQGCGAEAGLADCRRHRLVEGVVGRLDDLDILRLSAGVDIQLENDFHIRWHGFCCLWGKFNPGGVEKVDGSNSGRMGAG